MDLNAPDDEEEERMRKITSQIVAVWATASLNRAFGRWADNAFERIEERAKSGGTEQNARKGESGTAQQPTASPPALDVAAPTPGGGETKVGEEPDHGGPAGRLARDDGRLLDGSGGAGRDPTPNRNEPLCTVGLVFMEDKTMGFPRVFVMDVIPDRTATQCTLNGGNLLVLIDNEDVYGRDLEYIATILPGRRGTFVRLGFANVDRSFVEIDLERKFLATPEPAPAISSFHVTRASPQPSVYSPGSIPGLSGPPPLVPLSANTPPQRPEDYTWRGQSQTSPRPTRDAPDYLKYGTSDFSLHLVGA
eukprot:Tamp_15465.p1 GENE.Tamp_15465~~Tamp_15465.p1  ORF type:complete len:306 (-),score=24.29 Tamp_15465:473-1390(-)